MSDNEVALELLKLMGLPTPLSDAERTKVLEVYRQCLETVRSASKRNPS